MKHMKIFEQFYPDVESPVWGNDINTNKWLNLIAGADLRNEIKARSDEFLDIIKGYSDFEEYKNVFMRKSAKYRTADEFLMGLEKFISTREYFSIAFFIDKVKNTDGAEIVASFYRENILIVKVNTFGASQQLGSTQWSTSHEERYWNSYVADTGDTFYIIYDFNKDRNSPEARIGVIVSNDNIKYAYFQNDADAKEYIKSQPWLNQIIRP